MPAPRRKTGRKPAPGRGNGSRGAAEEIRRRGGAIARRLARLYPEVRCSLDFASPFELLVATILSAQCTDRRVNMVTPALFARWPTPAALAAAAPAELEGVIRSTGFYRAKARSLLGCAAALVERHAGHVPTTIEELVRLPGVGRKTANVVLGSGFGRAVGVVVDTHVGRITRRLGLSRHADPIRVERDLMAAVPRPHWIAWSHRLIAHGRAVCTARRPKCADCAMAGLCPRVGVKPPAVRGRRPSTPPAARRGPRRRGDRGG